MPTLLLWKCQCESLFWVLFEPDSLVPTPSVVQVSHSLRQPPFVLSAFFFFSPHPHWKIFNRPWGWKRNVPNAFHQLMGSSSSINPLTGWGSPSMYERYSRLIFHSVFYGFTAIGKHRDRLPCSWHASEESWSLNPNCFLLQDISLSSSI